jgi:hypothetical protein
MEQGAGHQHQNYIKIFITPPTLRRVAPAHSKRQRALPRLGDI